MSETIESIIPNYAADVTTIKCGGVSYKAWNVKFGEPVRTIQVREVDLVDNFDLLELGGSAASDENWMAMAMLAKALMEVDGAPVPIPSTKEHLRANLRKLGKDGLSAAARAMRPAEVTQDAALDAAKN